ncbi:hypothetical protein PEC301877_27750 [Pectobacterium carotovorum subsp. carotovorum]|nr:hypothetical protein PEC301877_27750 [Pectobacterium carotovorum subsp. carotovorum]
MRNQAVKRKASQENDIWSDIFSLHTPINAGEKVYTGQETSRKSGFQT